MTMELATISKLFLNFIVYFIYKNTIFNSDRIADKKIGDRKQFFLQNVPSMIYSLFEIVENPTNYFSTILFYLHLYKKNPILIISSLYTNKYSLIYF